MGEFRLESVVETTSDAVVYAARQDPLARSVRLYVSTTPVGTPAGERFRQRAQALAAVDDPRVVAVIDAGVADGHPYAAVPEAAGRGLDALLAERPLDPRAATRIVADVAGALEALGRHPEVVPPRAVRIVGEHALVEPLELPDDDGAPSSRAIAALLGTLVGEKPPARMRALLASPPASGPELARAAVAATRPVRRRRWWPWAAVAGSAAAVAVVAAVRGRDDVPARPRVLPAGRIAAVIALGVQPTSVTAGEGAIWVGGQDGTVLRVDPRTATVAGAPIHVSDPVEDSTVRAGAGAVFVVSDRTVSRIDPATRRVTRRATFDRPLSGATVADGALWVARNTLPNTEQRPNVLRLDPVTLRRLGHPWPAGDFPQDVEVGAGAVWTPSTADGTITRVDLRSGKRLAVRAGSGVVAGALGHGAFWAPDIGSGTVARIDARDGTVDPRVVRVGGAPTAATASPDAVWVMGLSGQARDAPGALHRIDPARRRELGAPVALGPGPGWPTAAYGAVWVYSRPRQALLKIVPTRPPPAPRTVRAPPRDEVRAGVLPAGRLRAPRAPAPLELTLPGEGWVGLAASEQEVWIGLVGDPRADLVIMPITNAFVSDTADVPVRDVDGALAALRRNHSLRLERVRRESLGGVAATRLDVVVDRIPHRSGSCPPTCLPVVTDMSLTTTGGPDTQLRIYLFERRGRVVSVAYSAPRDSPSIARLQEAVASVRFLS